MNRSVDIMKNILTENQEKTRFKINKHGEIFDENKNPIKIYRKTTSLYKGEDRVMKPRLYAYIQYNDGIWHKKQVARWVLMTYKPRKNVEKYEVNHKDGNPENNELSNLEWTTRKQNMQHAADNDLIPFGEKHHNSKYPDKLIHSICSDIAKGKTRSYIKKKYNVNGQLVYDIRAGRSHKKISRNYVDKGFKYSKFDKTESIKLAKKICKLIEKGLSNKEIVEKLNLTNTCLPNDIRMKRVYKYISKDYDI